MHKISGRLGNAMFQFAYIYAQMKKGLIPDVYVQDPVYFEECLDDIKRLYGQGIVPKEYIGIHVRRTDYVGNNFYVDLMKTDYYERAMSEFPGGLFKVFSDDIEWCKQQEVFQGCLFSDEPDEIKDFNDMAGCQHLVIANSSYSLMCGIVNPNKGKVVICPYEENYYKDGVIRTVFPKYFTRIKYEPR